VYLLSLTQPQNKYSHSQNKPFKKFAIKQYVLVHLPRKTRTQVALLKSVSGTRGTIGGKAGDNLTPIDIVSQTAAFGYRLVQRSSEPKVVIGRDARISGDMVSGLVTHTLRALGIHVIDLGLSTTPTVAMAVPNEQAQGGIIITASHNPRQWNALKFLNELGEFISPEEGREVVKLADSGDIEFATVDKLGSYTQNDTYIAWHINQILATPLIDRDLVASKQFTVVVDPVNSTGALAIPPLLEALGCQVILINGEINGRFAHNPEPLAENLDELSKAVLSHRAQLGIAVDPDVDRLVLVCEDGEMFGEENTLVAVADYVLKHKPGPTVSNLSSTRGLRDITEKHGQVYHASAVGEAHVVAMMKAHGATIGGEGNGGIIYPDLHYGRDAMIGTALFLTLLAKSGKSVSFLRSSLPRYVMSKNKIELTPDMDFSMIFDRLKEKYKKQPINTIDGLKIEFDSDWIHLRPSNTEPIIRIYTESTSEVMASKLASKIKEDIGEILMDRS
jgi:phosphomannomutase